MSLELRGLNRTFATARYDSQRRLISANQAFLRLIDSDLDAAKDQEIASLCPGVGADVSFNDVWRRLENGETVEDVRRWNGRSELWLKSRFAPFLDENGRFQEVVQIGLDVSADQRKAEETHGQIEAIDRTQVVVHYGPDGSITYVNDLALALTGYSAEDLLGRNHSVLVADQSDSIQEYLKFWNAPDRAESLNGIFATRRKEGGEIWLQAVYSPIRDTSGRLIKIVQYAMDVTAEKLRQAEFQWQVTAIHKSNAVISFDMYGTILDANPTFLDAMGYSHEEIVGRHHKIFVDSSEAHSAEYAIFWSDMRRGQHRSGLYKRHGKDGREVWLQATYNPIFDIGGAPVRVIKYASVVTNEKLLQAEHQGQIAAIHRAQCVASFTLDGVIVDANENFLNAVGYRYQDVRGRHHRLFVDEADAASKEYQDFWGDLAAGRPRSGEYRRIAQSGQNVWFQATYNPILDMSGRPFKVVKYATDITLEKVRQAEFEGQIEAINKSQGVVSLSLEGEILDANENFLQMVGYARDELVGQHHSFLIDALSATQPDYLNFWASLRQGDYQSGLFRRKGKDGKEVWIQASYNPILDPSGRPRKVIKYATDVSSNVALAEAFEDAKRQAQLDAATSLPNRVKLTAFMNAHLATPDASLVVFYIDLDRFKPINDRFGHHVGDRVLGELADRLRRVLHNDQIAARMGGDEFVIAAPGMPPDEIDGFCRILYDQLTAPIRHEQGEISVNVSMGIAISPHDGATSDDLLRAADTALYRAKESGRGQVSYFANEMNEKIQAQRALVADMRHSLVAEHFFLEYQPRFSTRNRQIISAEALVRWEHPERGRIPPMEFIPLAEMNGLIVPLGEWILRTACRTAASWNNIGISVNVSPLQLRDAKFIQKVEACLVDTGLRPALLELEITEGILLEDAELSVRVLTQLKELGVRLAIDDFGTGYSSLSYLRKFPFDVIKIDRSFIGDLDSSHEARPIVQAILALGRTLGKSVTAEGVETNEQLALLTADHCDEIQGFLLSKPLRESQISEVMREMQTLIDHRNARAS